MTGKVLIVDDEPDIRELLEITLGRMSLITESASTMASAMTLLSTRRFDLCLTDMRLPDGDGLRLVDFIQQNRIGWNFSQHGVKWGVFANGVQSDGTLA